MSELTSKLLEGIEDFCIRYVDDLFLASHKTLDFDEHMEQLDILFSRIKSAKLRIKPDKLLVYQHTFEFIVYFFDAKR